MQAWWVDLPSKGSMHYVKVLSCFFFIAVQIVRQQCITFALLCLTTAALLQAMFLKCMQGLFAHFGEHQGEGRDPPFHTCMRRLLLQLEVVALFLYFYLSAYLFIFFFFYAAEVVACERVGLAVSLADCLLPQDIQSVHSVGVASHGFCQALDWCSMSGTLYSLLSVAM